MKLYYQCHYCRSQNTLSFKANSRFDIKTTANNRVVVVCTNCSKSNQVKLNEIKARESLMSKVSYVLGLWIALLLGALILFTYWDDDLGIGLGVLEVFGIGIAIPILVASVIVNQERKSVKLFNNHYV